METKYFFYVDYDSSFILESNYAKTILIGSDLGYGNFGDILQQRGCIDFHRKYSTNKIVGIIDAQAINDSQYIEFIKKALNFDAIIVVSEIELSFDQNIISLQLLHFVYNVNIIHLYGGGFLNEKWGNYVLGITEEFLTLFTPNLYIVSGQQISNIFIDRLIPHLKLFKPAVFGCRDDMSFRWMTETGYSPHFSFDDATEELQKLAQQLQLQKGRGVLLHLNISDYTFNFYDINDNLLKEIDTLLQLCSTNNLPITLFQAYNDKRLVVLDTRETLKELDKTILFYNYRVIELANIAYNLSSYHFEPICGNFAYSCSYHVALLMQLAGIPCWLRGFNEYYLQKRHALQINQNFKEFLKEPQLANHSTNLARRAEWCDHLASLLSVAENHKITKIDYSNNNIGTTFVFKSNNLQAIKNEIQMLQTKLKEAKHSLNIAKKENESLNSIILGLGENITQLGSLSHNYILRAEVAEKKILSLSTEIMQIKQSYNDLINSTSWKITKPLRKVMDKIRMMR